MDPYTNLTEKSRPSNLSEVVGQPHVTKFLKKYVSKGKMPHLLFTGPPGTGKTASTHALASEIFGPHKNFNLHTFNASKNRGIDFIRNTISDLCMVEPIGSNFQIIFLDEGDSLTEDAQEALREIMMEHTSITKFILGCNRINKIIEPIQDRCRIFRFRRLDTISIKNKLIEICKRENIDAATDALHHIALFSNGSLRRAINNLETFHDEDEKITLDLIESSQHFLQTNHAEILLKSALNNDIQSYEKLLFTLYYEGGFDPEEILDSILTLTNEGSYPPSIIPLIGEYDWRISQGASPLLQLRCFLKSLGDLK